MKKPALYILILVAILSCNEDSHDPIQTAHKCAMSATVNGETLCSEDSRYIIAYASVAGEPSVFSLHTPYITNSNIGYCQIVIETTEFTGPGKYAIREYDGGSERATYGFFASLNADRKGSKVYNSVSGTFVVESVKHIEGTTNGLATGTFTMTAQDDDGNIVNICGSLNDLPGMGWWED